MVFRCICGGMGFYSDEFHILSENIIIDSNGNKSLEPIRSIKYYTCVKCDRRFIYSATEEAFVSSPEGF